MKTKAVCLCFTVQETTFQSHWSGKKKEKWMNLAIYLMTWRETSKVRKLTKHTLGNINAHSYTDIGQLDGKW